MILINAGNDNIMVPEKDDRNFSRKTKPFVARKTTLVDIKNIGLEDRLRVKKRKYYSSKFSELATEAMASALNKGYRGKLESRKYNKILSEIKTYDRRSSNYEKRMKMLRKKAIQSPLHFFLQENYEKDKLIVLEIFRVKRNSSIYKGMVDKLREIIRFSPIWLFSLKTKFPDYFYNRIYKESIKLEMIDNLEKILTLEKYTFERQKIIRLFERIYRHEQEIFTEVIEKKVKEIVKQFEKINEIDGEVKNNIFKQLKFIVGKYPELAKGEVLNYIVRTSNKYKKSKGYNEKLKNNLIIIFENLKNEMPELKKQTYYKILINEKTNLSIQTPRTLHSEDFATYEGKNSIGSKSSSRSRSSGSGSRVIRIRGDIISKMNESMEQTKLQSPPKIRRIKTSEDFSKIISGDMNTIDPDPFCTKIEIPQEILEKQVGGQNKVKMTEKEAGASDGERVMTEKEAGASDGERVIIQTSKYSLEKISKSVFEQIGGDKTRKYDDEVIEKDLLTGDDSDGYYSSDEEKGDKGEKKTLKNSLKENTEGAGVGLYEMEKTKKNISMPNSLTMTSKIELSRDSDEERTETFKVVTKKINKLIVKKSKFKRFLSYFSCMGTSTRNAVSPTNSISERYLSGDESTAATTNTPDIMSHGNEITDLRKKVLLLKL